MDKNGRCNYDVATILANGKWIKMADVTMM